MDVKRLQIKYNNIKQNWRKIADKKKTGSGLAYTKDPDWFAIINPILSDANHGVEAVCSDPADTSFARQQYLQHDFDDDDESGENELTESPEAEQNGFNSQNEEHEQGQVNECTIDNNENTSKRKKVVAKPHEKRSVPRSQLQALSQLAAGVDKLAEVNAKRMKIEEKDREAILQFRREEAEKIDNMKKKWLTFTCVL